MFSKELENLIQATLEDGILEENEKAALVKRAQAEGVDLAELEIYINSLLQKRQRELNEKKNAEYAKAEQQKKEAIGKVCPKCGKQVKPMTLVCECGFELIKKDEGESAVAKLQKKIEKINSQNGMNEETKRQQIMDAVKIMPIPNTKEDIMDFLAMSAPQSRMKGGFYGTTLGRIIVSIVGTVLILVFFGTQGARGIDFLILLPPVAAAMLALNLCVGTDMLKDNRLASAWRTKFEQVMMKGRSLRGDAEFSQMLDYYENQVNKK